MRTMLVTVRSLQRSVFRENRLIKLILITRILRRIVCGTNKPSKSELEHGQTDRQTDRPNYSNTRCACAPRVNNAMKQIQTSFWYHSRSRVLCKNTQAHIDCYEAYRDTLHTNVHGT